MESFSSQTYLTISPLHHLIVLFGNTTHTSTYKEIYLAWILYPYRPINIEIVSTMGSGPLGREFNLRPLVDELVESAEALLDANFTSEGMVTLYLGDAYHPRRVGPPTSEGMSSPSTDILLDESVAGGRCRPLS
jgi:hypothetical protein